MFEFFSKLWDVSDYPAHCGNWTNGEGWLHILSDTAIWGAYFAIPVAFLYYLYKKMAIPKPLPIAIWLFILFIFFCGFGHLVDAMMFVYPCYRFLGVAKLCTAVVSWITVGFLIRYLPALLALRSVSEIRLQELTKELSRSNKELEQFAYVTSHDLKAPLRAISNLSDWIRQEVKAPTEELEKYLELMESRVYRMENLINGNLEFSRIGRLETKSELVDLNDIVSTVIEDIGGNFDITVEDLPSVYINPIRVTQIFSNLISNSIKHHDKTNGKIWIRCEEKDEEYLFCVEDDGPGIEKKYQEKVFGMFQTLTRDEEATGIGLTLVQRIVNLYRGSIWIKSEGRGTEIYFTIPK